MSLTDDRDGMRAALRDFFDRAGAETPQEILSTLATLDVQLSSWDPTPPPPPPEPETRRVALGVDDHGAVVARTPEAEPVARTLRTILDALAGKALGSMAQAALEFAAHIEAIELENAALRKRCGEYEAAMGGR